ncbi:MAG: RNA 2',3'-cyclic phosphodiesterase [Bacilli bacterium]
MRTFIGIKPLDCLYDLVVVQNNLRTQTQAHFTKPENIHLTLFFLGEIDDSQIEKVKKVFDKMVFKSFSLEINEITNFKDMIIAKTKKNFQLDGLYKKLKDLLMDQGFLFENRPYFSHITLARETSYQVKKDVSYLFNVNTVTLFSSERDNNGLKYRPIGRFDLD